MQFRLYLHPDFASGVERVVVEGSPDATSLLIVSIVQPLARWNLGEFPAYSQMFPVALLQTGPCFPRNFARIIVTRPVDYGSAYYYAVRTISSRKTSKSLAYGLYGFPLEADLPSVLSCFMRSFTDIAKFLPYISMT